MTWKKGTEDKEYICTYQLDGANVGRLTIASIEVIDEYDNQASYAGVRESGDYKYWVDVEPQVNETIKVKKFDFPDNGDTGRTRGRRHPGGGHSAYVRPPV